MLRIYLVILRMIVVLLLVLKSFFIGQRLLGITDGMRAVRRSFWHLLIGLDLDVIGNCGVVLMHLLVLRDACIVVEGVCARITPGDRSLLDLQLDSLIVEVLGLHGWLLMYSVDISRWWSLLSLIQLDLDAGGNPVGIT